jgi:hypothetical protein
MPTVPTGARFTCSVCKSEFIVTKGADARLVCCEKTVEKK